MKKLLLSTLFIFVFTLGTSISINAQGTSNGLGQPIKEVIKDDIVAQAVAKQLKTDVDHVISQEDIDSLNVINLTKTGVKSLEGLEIFVNMGSLMLDYNELNEIPKEVFTFKKLYYLGMNSNNITIIPEKITELSKLEHLSFNFNKINAIPEDIGKLDKLKYINFTNNNITSIPTSIGNLVNLETLYIFGNNIQEIPNEITNLSNLELIQLGGNNINKLSDEQFNFIKTIQTHSLVQQSYSYTDDTKYYKNDNISINKIEILDNLATFIGKENISINLSRIDSKGNLIVVSTDINDVLENNKFVVKKDLIKNGAAYKLVVTTSDNSSELKNSKYTYNFNVNSSVTINYLDEQGKQLVPSDIIYGELGASYNIKPESIKNYKLVKVNGKQKDKFNENDKEVTYIYKKVEKKTTHKKIAKAGNEQLYVSMIALMIASSALVIKQIRKF
ncbi:MAG: MucBP domain-containing protein [Erysipelotrichales bacterium]